jgi:hypothetical protein
MPLGLAENRMLGEQKMEPITVNGGKGAIQLGADGVVYLAWKPGIVLEGDDVHAAMATLREITDGS